MTYALLWIWLSHIGNCCLLVPVFNNTYILETVLELWRNLQYLRQSVIKVARGVGSRTCTCGVPQTNISRQQNPSTATKQRTKLPELSCCCVVNVCDCKCRHPFMSSCGSFHIYKEEDKLLHPYKMSKSSQDTCKHYMMFFCVSCPVRAPGL